MTINHAPFFLIANRRKKPFEEKNKKKKKTANRILPPRGRERARKGSVAAALIKHSTRSGPSLDPVAVIIGRSEAPSRCPGEAKRERKETKVLPPGL